MIGREATAPEGYRTIDAYAIAPDARHPRYLVPLMSRTAASRAVGAYGSLRTGPRRLAGAIAARGLRLGLTQHLLRDRIFVHVARDVPDAELRQISLMHYLASILGTEQVTGLVGLGGSGPYAKPVIQVLSTDGDPLAFTKVGWDKISTQLVLNEARALHLCARGNLRTIRMPGLIHSGTWKGLAFALTSPLPDGVRRYTGVRLPSLAITQEIYALTGAPAQRLWEGPYASQLNVRTADLVKGAEGRRTQHSALSWLRRQYPDAQLRIGMWHGDWVPWNLATRGADLHAWDWEYSADAVPLGFDVLHFFFHSALIGQGRSLSDAILRARAASAGPLRQLGVPGSLTDLVLALYLIEASFRAEEVVRLGGIPNPRIYPGILAAVEQLSHVT